MSPSRDACRSCQRGPELLVEAGEQREQARARPAEGGRWPVRRRHSQRAAPPLLRGVVADLEPRAVGQPPGLGPAGLAPAWLLPLGPPQFGGLPLLLLPFLPARLAIAAHGLLAAVLAELVLVVGQ